MEIIKVDEGKDWVRFWALIDKKLYPIIGKELDTKNWYGQDALKDWTWKKSSIEEYNKIVSN